MSKIKNKWLVKTEDDGYLVQGTLCGVAFDGEGKPYLFTKSDAKLIAEVTGGKVEEHMFPVLCHNCHINSLCPLSGKLSNGAKCDKHLSPDDKEQIKITEVHESNIPKVTDQMLIDAGLNAFGLKLFVESITTKEDVKTFPPLTFIYKGVKTTIQPLKKDGE